MQVSLFIADLAEHAQSKTQYYLGHYILELKNVMRDVDGRTPVDIVDGQQRLTTVAIFLAVCRCLSNSHDHGPSIRLSVVEYDKKRFDEILLADTLNLLASQEDLHEETASLERVVLAIQTFYKSFENRSKPALLSVERINDYLDVISKAAVSVGVYESKAVAAQIFELHNTRGVLLTETEKVKALLMKYVYLNSIDEDVAEIQASFADVFMLEEKAAFVSFRGEMSLDDILAHHLRAVDDGEKQKLFTQPQSVEGENGCVDYVRKKLAAFIDNRKDGVTYAKNLARELAKTMDLVSRVFIAQDIKVPLIGDVILLDQRRSMIFLLRYFRAFNTETSFADYKLLRRWESFLSIWDCHDVFYNMKSGKKDSFSAIFEQIKVSHTEVSGMLQEYYSGFKPFAYRKFEDGSTTGLGGLFQDYIDKHEEHLLHRAHIWGHWHGRYKYWLYKYEVEMAGDQEDKVRQSLRNLFKENDVTLDHIVPRGLEWKELSGNGAQNSELKDWDPTDKEQAEKIWEEIGKTINGIGNLVLMSRSSNASLQNIAPFKRTSEYRKFQLESISYNEVEAWKPRAKWIDGSNDAWNLKIEERGKRILTKIKEYLTDQATWLP